MQVLEEAALIEAAGHRVVHMEVGEPRFSVAEPILSAAKAALDSEPQFYTPAMGLPALREKVSEFYKQRYQLDIAPKRIIITTGGSAALMMLCHLLVRSGDGVLVTDPGYPCNANFIQLVGGEPQKVPVKEVEHFSFAVEQLKASWRPNTRGVILASPSNPTGEVLSETELKAIAAEVKDRQGFLIMDEIYHGLTYGKGEPDQRPASILQYDDSAFVVNSFSKYFGMTGWRLGWMVVPEEALDGLDRLAQNLFIAPPTLAQHAALAAFLPETLSILEQRREVFCQRRDYLYDALEGLGFSLSHKPEGAFYLYAGIRQFIESGKVKDSEEFCRRLLTSQHVAVTPGTDFGDYLADEYVRFAYTAEMEDLKLAVSRLEVFTNEI